MRNEFLQKGKNSTGNLLNAFKRKYIPYYSWMVIRLTNLLTIKSVFMKQMISLLLFVSIVGYGIAQNIGIGTSSPVEKLDVNGAIKIGSSAGNNAGTVRYAAGKFEGNNGVTWQAFTQLPAGTLVASAINPNVPLQSAGFSFFNTFFVNKVVTISSLPNSWLATQLTGAPEPRSSCVSVWTGTKMIVWGGFGTDFLNTGSIYDPIADSWVAMAASPLSARYLPTIVWTGSVAIIWGGYGNAGYCNDGASYNPATNTWGLLSTTLAPTARYNHTAIWTGTEMIIWGGYVNGGKTNTGARYNPVSNLWVTLPLAPIQERGAHTAVWTGTQMIVWGGEDNFATRKNDGAMYSPGTNTWIPTAIGGNVPSARLGHSAVWTGSEMIIWGGLNTGVGFFNTGGKFTPGTNSWGAVTSVSNAPALRSGHTAIWTGTEMIVWGGTGPGSSNYTFYNTGGRYNPGSNSWTSVSLAGAPLGRSSFTTTWTGNQMIVFGGANPSDGVFNSGGRYIINSEPNVATVEPSSLYLFIKN